MRGMSKFINIGMDDEWIEEGWGRYSILNLCDILFHTLHTAARWGDLHTVRAELSCNPTIAGELDRNGFSPLHLASEMGHLDIVRELLRVDSKLCLVKDKFGMTPLDTAVKNGRLDVVGELLSACSESLTQVTGRSETPLHIAVLHNQVKVVQLLVNWLLQTNNIDFINSKDRSGNTVLHLATSGEQLPTIEILLRHNPTINSAVVEINAMNAGGFTALDILDDQQQYGVMDKVIHKILGRAGALRAEDVIKPAFDYSNYDCFPLHKAASMGDLHTVRAKLSSNPRINAADLDGNGVSPLHLASEMGHLDIARELLRVDSKLCLVNDKFGMTPLHTAVQNGRLDVVQELLSYCPESLTQVTRSKTPLHIAVQYNQIEAVQLLVNWLQQTNNIHLINSKDRRGNTVLHLATSSKQLPTIEILLRHSPTISAVVEINALNAGGFTALDILDVLPQCGKMDMEIDKILRQAGALRVRDIIKQTFHNSNQKGFIHSHRSVVVVIATLLAAVTFYAGLWPPGGAWEGGNTYKSYLNNTLQLEKQNLNFTRWFIFFNSVGFFTSIAMIISLMHDVPWKPWLFISVSSLVGSYLCAIIEISPSEAPTLVLLGSPFVLLAAAPTRCTSRGMGLNCSKWGCIKNLGI